MTRLSRPHRTDFKAAKNLAQDKLLDLYSRVDTGAHKWRAKPIVPAICDFREAAIAFGFKCSAPYPFTMKENFFDANIALRSSDGMKARSFRSR